MQTVALAARIVRLIVLGMWDLAVINVERFLTCDGRWTL
jgi:hypothetical protein